MRVSERRSKVRIISLVAIAILSLVFFFPSSKCRLSNLPQLNSFHKTTTTSSPAQPLWLVATMSAAPSQRRRNIIRATMHTPYADPAICFRFVLADPTERWAPLIRHENDTFGDIIVLSHLPESPHVANTVKTVELLKLATSPSFTCGAPPAAAAAAAARLPPWRFVSKVDDDSFVALAAFFREYLAPLLAEEQRADRDLLDAGGPTTATSTTTTTIPSSQPHLLIGRKLQGHRPFPYPGGQFYTLSHHTAATLVRQQLARAIVDEDEDVLVGRLLHEARQAFNVTHLPNPVAFDFSASVADQAAWSHDVSRPSNLNPHKMKSDELFLDVARRMALLHPPGPLDG